MRSRTAIAIVAVITVIAVACMICGCSGAGTPAPSATPTPSPATTLKPQASPTKPVGTVIHGIVYYNGQPVSGAVVLQDNDFICTTGADGAWQSPPCVGYHTYWAEKDGMRSLVAQVDHGVTPSLDLTIGVDASDV